MADSTSASSAAAPRTPPSLADLPAPPAGKTGWPWTLEAPKLSATLPDGAPWPRISVVTPSYNQGRFIEETIRSILLQGYPDLEYIITDGGSTDETVEIIRKYEPWITYWVSEKDRGAQHAINKGLARSTGFIVTWLNSDDIYRERVFEEVAGLFAANPEADIISGVTRMVGGPDPERFVGPSPFRTFEEICSAKSWTSGKSIVQPETFFTARIYAAAGPIREDLALCYDYMFWVSAADKGAQFISVDRHWVDFRRHPAQKSWNFTSNRQELATAIMTYCFEKPDLGKDELVRIGSGLLGQMNYLINFERDRATAEQRYRGSTSYRLGRMITRLRFW
jgi:glycosyltransferase involved in cell wall biosynthesis